MRAYGYCLGLQDRQRPRLLWHLAQRGTRECVGVEQPQHGHILSSGPPVLLLLPGRLVWCSWPAERFFDGGGAELLPACRVS